MKRQPTNWEKIFANLVSNKELISKILKEQIIQFKKKNGLRDRTGIFPWKTHRWLTSTWCLTSQITREMHIKTTVKYHSHLLEWLLSKRQEVTSVGDNIEKREPYIVPKNVYWCIHCEKPYLGRRDQDGVDLHSPTHQNHNYI